MGEQRRVKVTDDYAYSYPCKRKGKQDYTFTCKVTIQLGDKIYKNAKITFDEATLQHIVHTYETHTGNYGGGFGGM